MARKVFLLLTEFPTRGARFMGWFTRFRYTHASIGLEEDMNIFYTFRHSGFFVEEITRYIRKDRTPFPCQLYEFETSEEAYVKIKELIDSFKACNEHMRYTQLGLIMSLCRIPYKKRFRYFCSHFVADVLGGSNAVKLKKKSHLYLPNDLRKLEGMNLVFQGDMQSYLLQYKIPCPNI